MSADALSGLNPASLRGLARQKLAPSLSNADLAAAVPRTASDDEPGGRPPELAALWAGLSIYSGAFIAEIVRSSVQAVSQGQREAARSIGLRPRPVPMPDQRPSLASSRTSAPGQEASTFKRLVKKLVRTITPAKKAKKAKKR